MTGDGGAGFPVEEVLQFLKRRRGQLGGLVVSGGEPTLQPGLEDFLARVKGLGVDVRLDTNGSRPEILARLLSRGLVDSVGLDIKAPIDRYAAVAGAAADIAAVLVSVSIVLAWNGDHEFRTTVPRSLFVPDDVEACVRLAVGARRYVLQRFVPSCTLDPLFEGGLPYSEEELKTMCRSVGSLVKTCIWR